jgi:uncharacterized BrkB/YihY/UPF0761 family membrane protein
MWSAWMGHALHIEAGLGGFLAAVTRFAVGFGIAFGLVAGLYALGLPGSVRRHFPIAPGAVIVVVAEAALAAGYGLYLARVGYGDAYQAGLAVVGVTLMTLYLVVVVFLGGLEINGMIADGRRGEGRVGDRGTLDAGDDRGKDSAGHLAAGSDGATNDRAASRNH